MADIRQSTDYSPFGVTLEDRNLTLAGAEKNRYGFNGMEADDEIKGEGNSIEYDITIKRDFILVSMSTLNLTNSEGLALAQNITSTWGQSVFSYLIDASTAESSMLEYMIRKQYSHIPSDYSLEFKVNVDFVVGEVSYMTTTDPTQINNNATLIGIVDNMNGNEVGLTLRSDAVVIQKDYISTKDMSLASGEVLKSSNVSLHELAHEEGAEDNYTGTYNGSGAMGKAGTSFVFTSTGTNDTKREIAINALRRARSAHDVLMGDAVNSAVSSPINPKWYQNAIEKGIVPYGKAHYDTNGSKSNGQILNDLKTISGN